MEEDAEVRKQIKEFEENYPLFEEFGKKAAELIWQFLSDKEINFQGIAMRVKSPESLAEKIKKTGLRWDEIQDLAGIRVVAYTYSDAAKVSLLLKENFKIDDNLSSDKSEMLGTDRAGYRAKNYVASLGEAREKLSEYQKFKDLKFEVQVHTVLENAWSEIQHDRNYKFRGELPKDIRRKFNLLSGTLELIDHQFEGLSKEIEEYTQRVDETIKIAPQNVSIDRISLDSFIMKSDIPKRLDAEIAHINNAKLVPNNLPNTSSSKILKFFNIKTIGELEEALQKNSERIKFFARKWIERKDVKYFRQGICIFYLGYVLAGLTQNEKEIRRYLDNFHFSGKDDMAKRILDITYEVS